MNRVPVWVAAAALACSGVVRMSAQGVLPDQERRGDTSIDIVEVVGCLSEGPFNTWILTHGTEPLVSNSNSLTAEAIKAAEAKPLGEQEHRLVVVSEFDPWAHRGHKVVVRGVLAGETPQRRISVTALRRASFTCVKQ